MFEEEAEYYAFDEMKHKQEWYIKHPEHSIDCDYEDIKKHWGKGAEFGYNKANEWHYVKDGEYPKDEKKVLCILGDFENDNLEVGYYSQVEGDSKRWRFENYDLPDDSENGWGVSAWKEIILPKESK